jgi:hypothetical protein
MLLGLVNERVCRRAATVADVAHGSPRPCAGSLRCPGELVGSVLGKKRAPTTDRRSKIG